MEQQIIQSAKPAINDLIKLAKASSSQIWVDNDREADVLYMSFGKPQKADNPNQQQNIIQNKKEKRKGSCFSFEETYEIIRCILELLCKQQILVDF